MSKDDVADWSERYRPRRFEDVVGQDSAVTALRAQIIKEEPRHILFVGPSGTGKTTLARIYAAAINCHAIDPFQKPCGTCEACRDFAAGYRGNYEEYSSRSRATLEELRIIEETVQYTPLGSWATRAFFFDEAQGLLPPAVDVLLKLTEPHAIEAVFLFATLDREQLPYPLRTRCIPVETKHLDEAIAGAFLAKIAAAENLTLEAGAGALIAQVSQSGRELVKNLERVSLTEGHRITVAGVQKALVNDRVARMVSYFSALAAGDLDAQLLTVAGSVLAPDDVLATIQQVLVYLRLRYVATEAVRPSVLHRFLDLIDPADCMRIVTALRERAEAAGVPFRALYDEMMEFWAFTPARWTPEAMNLQLIRFHDLVNAHRGPVARGESLGSSARPTLAPAPPMREGAVAAGGSTRRFRRPPQWRVLAEQESAAEPARQLVPANRLSVEQVQDLYEAATFLVQTHGVLFNFRLTLAWPRLGVEDGLRAADLTARLAHELGLRLIDWGLEEAGGFHRISLHEGGDAADGLRSHLIGHVPERHEARLQRWVRKRFLPRHLPGCTVDDGVQIEVGSSQAKRATVGRHWQLMRLLWSGLDTGVTVEAKPGQRPALSTLLKIPAQRSIGAIQGRRYAMSDGINVGARRAAAAQRMAHLSIFEDAARYGQAAWDALDTGWELAEFGERRKELQRRQVREDELRNLYDVANDRLFTSSYTLTMKAELAGRAVDPHERSREHVSWCWWRPT